ncbi:MAG: Sec-independent protein translocase protein TatB [Desulfocapsaceae bacterium]|nr:Sec-independent protein translocase protein TatB [Desulfocapsaceae bacterium]
MFGIGFPELLLILALALIVVGPDKLPEIARSIAKTLVDLKKTAEGLKESFDEEDNPLKDIKPQLEDAAKNFKETILDEENKPWKPSQELEELKSVIDTTTHEPENLATQNDSDGAGNYPTEKPTIDDITKVEQSQSLPDETKSQKDAPTSDQHNGTSQ